MKLTPVLLLLPVFLFYLARALPNIPHAFKLAYLVAWFLSALLNLGWGIRVSRKSKFQGVLCAAVGLIQIVWALFLPTVSGTRL
jgi:hypothetical protein